MDVEPVKPSPAFGAQAVIQVEPVNVDDDSFHEGFLGIHKRDDPPLRVGVGPEMLSLAGYWLHCITVSAEVNFLSLVDQVTISSS